MQVIAHPDTDNAQNMSVTDDRPTTLVFIDNGSEHLAEMKKGPRKTFLNNVDQDRFRMYVIVGDLELGGEAQADKGRYHPIHLEPLQGAEFTAVVEVLFGATDPDAAARIYAETGGAMGRIMTLARRYGRIEALRRRANEALELPAKLRRLNGI